MSDSAQSNLNSFFAQTVAEVFGFTTSKSNACIQTEHIGSLVYIDPSDSVAEAGISDAAILEQVLFERLLLDNPSGSLICCNPNRNGINDGHFVDKECLSYLFECYRRLFGRRNGTSSEKKNQSIAEMIGLVLRNVTTALKQPDLYESQNLPKQIINFFVANNATDQELSSFFLDVAKEFLQETDGMAVMLTAFTPTLNAVHEDFKIASVLILPLSHFYLLQVFASNPHLAQVIIDHSTPSNAAVGKTFQDTLLGSILSISCLPRSVGESHEFFDRPMEQVSESVEGNIWSGLKNLHNHLHSLFHTLLKASANVRHITLRWLGTCLDSNAARGNLWNTASDPFAALTGSLSIVGDGFAMNLSALLLKLSEPFIRNVKDPKLFKIDPTYCAVKITTDEGSQSKGVHLRKLCTETCLLPAEENTERPISEQPFSFITECFFMTHRAIDLSFRVVLDKLIRVNQDLARMQSAFLDAQQQVGGTNNDVMRVVHEQMEVDMKKFLSMKAVLLEPTYLSLVGKFFLATAVWLVQVAVNTEIPPYAPLKMRPVVISQLRQSESSSRLVTLTCIPEFLLENLWSYLMLVRRWNPRALEEEGLELLEPLLTLILVFMGSNNFVRNPHLRAKLAECLEHLIPNRDEEAPAINPNPLGFFYREKLFQEHPFRAEIVPALLDVFVGIEMTGQSVQFEQKFNYRRPMYTVMNYLWTLPEQRESFRNLAIEAESNIEAVNPPLFLRFINLLMNDAVYLLDEALSNMAQLKQLQNKKESGEWQALPQREREQNEANFQHIGMIARFDCILGRETIHTLEYLSSEIQMIFVHSTMVDRVAAMLNYFLFHLVGPKKKNFKVRDMKEYKFDPANLVLNICKIYVHLGKNDSFCAAVSRDGRSYSPQLFSLAEQVLSRIGGGALIADLQTVAKRVALLESQQKTDEILLAEAPDEFLDPIMSTLMTDPVILPSSRTTVDRTTIARHLLSDQSDPFNREPLTMDMVKSNTELKASIEKWIEEKRREQAATSSSDQS
ncbi:unnamed protein product [Bemisia tabaci]|uniref:Ubiquitin conjugation factor E4 A n=1 Tax=Bemisia tabaci TaxID=7038 RepID=A0A9P0AHU1_BEMTA|nr:unnamed protein product [Bemisia tabaci]